MKYTFTLAGDQPVKINIEVPSGTEEQVVLDVLVRNSGKTLMMDQIIAAAPGFGNHPEFEAHERRTTTRKMRQILRNLRDMGVPIVATVRGNKIAESTFEIMEFCEWLERKAKSDIASMLSVRKKFLRIAESRQRSISDKIKSSL